MISAATAFVSVVEDSKGFSAIARSVMISAQVRLRLKLLLFRFSAIARSVMISASEQDATNLKSEDVSVL